MTPTFQPSEETRSSPLAAISIAIFLLSLVTFNWNLVGSADPALFSNFQDDSDILVLDALYANEPMLGRNGPNGFNPYPSQFGAQVPMLRALGGLSIWSPEGLSHLVASTMAVIVALTTYLVGLRLFQAKGALAFGLVFALSPVCVMIAGSIYWMSWSWLLPLLVSLWLVPRLWTLRGMAIASIFWWSTLTLTNLFGYEYASTIAISAAAPIAYVGFRNGFSPLRTAVPCLVLACTSVLAMLTAITLHANRLPSSESGLDGWQQIALTAEKRLAHDSDMRSLAAACDITPGIAMLEGVARAAQHETCVTNLARAQAAPLPVVLAAYATFRRTVPWLGGSDIIDIPEFASARRALRQGDFATFVARLREDDLFVALIYLPATMLIVWVAIIVTALRMWHRRGRGGGAQAMMLSVGAMAPLSWFILASAHSYGHMHISYVLWTIPFLPLLAGVLIDEGAIHEKPK